MITIGIIGAGYWGPNLIRNFNDIPECQIKYICDTRHGRLDFVKENYPGIRLTTDYLEVLNDTEVKGVIIATPVASHFTLAIEALDKEKDVFIEKPFTKTTKEAEELVHKAQKLKKIVMVGHLFEYHPAVTLIKTLIDNDAIGEIYYIDAARINMGPPESLVNVVWDLAPHDLSIIMFLLGMRPESLRAIGREYRSDQWLGLIQAAYITLEFPNKIFAQIHNGWLSPNKTRRIEIFGSKGVIAYDDMKEKKITLFDEGKDSRKEGGSNTATNLAYGIGKVTYPGVPSGEPLKNECIHFINCIRTRISPRSDGIDGLHVVKIIEKANESIVNQGAHIKL